jgi:hypothetical protein
MTNDRNLQDQGDGEFYAEPAQLGRADILGVALALVSLAVIGVLGYVWLNPDLDVGSIRSWFKPPPGATETVVATAEQSELNVDVGDGAAQETTSCPVCGMYSERSDAHIVVAWSDGSHTHHDAWDCAFKWMQQQELTITRAQAVAYGSPKEAPTWLPAESASYLYGTKELKISMPPYIAAFADAASAEAARAELGGHIIDWAALQQHFGVEQ